MPVNVRTSLTAALAGFGLFLTACGSPAADTAGAKAGGRIAVVASTNVYGDIVAAVGGDKVNVSAIISRPSQDPHSYEANAQDRLTVSKAKLVLENGGGYDDFIHTLADDSNVPHENIISAVDVSGLASETGGTGSAHAEDGHSHVHGEFNEHVWYSFDAMSHLADAVAARLGALDSASSAQFTANAAAFKTGLAKLESKDFGNEEPHTAAPVSP